MEPIGPYLFQCLLYLFIACPSTSYNPAILITRYYFAPGELAYFLVTFNHPCFGLSTLGLLFLTYPLECPYPILNPLPYIYSHEPALILTLISYFITLEKGWGN